MNIAGFEFGCEIDVGQMQQSHMALLTMTGNMSNWQIPITNGIRRDWTNATLRE
tara:strand:- start:174 stop:335 length:162 start_codon:yes stop_codon:yes gene_type:complete